MSDLTQTDASDFTQTDVSHFTQTDVSHFTQTDVGDFTQCADLEGEGGRDARREATWKRDLKLPWRETGSPNHHDDIVDSNQ